MLFNSFDFLIFFIIVFLAYWSLSKNTKYQNILLLISSYIFYAWWDWRFLSLILISSSLDYIVGLRIFTSKTKKQFKPTKDIISFFTYIAFFPQLVAGPIERASNLLPQVENKRIFKREWFNEGIIQILVGLFRKIVIADTLGAYVDTIYGNIGLHNSTTIILATFFYAFQIYYDFAGYSDIAIGAAKLLGFKFNQNFNLPYFSKSLTEFWRKWHMSLSYWLRDYLYISLGGNRKGIKITYRNLMLTMLLGGLWHGSSWNFIIWGGDTRNCIKY